MSAGQSFGEMIVAAAAVEADQLTNLVYCVAAPDQGGHATCADQNGPYSCCGDGATV